MKRPKTPDLNQLRIIGWALWDPLELKNFLDHELVKPPVDEYDTYLLRAAGMLINGRSEQHVSDYLLGIISDYMGLDPDEFDPKATTKTVEAIREYVERL